MGRLIKKDALQHVPLALEHADVPLWNLIDAQRRKEEFICQAKEGTIELSLRLAQKIVASAIHMDGSLLQKMYEETVAQVALLGPGKMFIHPSGGQITTIAKVAKQAGFEIIEDNTLQPPDCVVEASGIRIDSTLDTALYLLRKSMSKC